VIKDNAVTQIRFAIREAKTTWIGDIEDKKDVMISTKSNGSKRTFDEIRLSILYSLLKGQRTINQIAGDTNINWKTVEKHLTFLLGKDFVNEIFKSEYVRIFELTQDGRSHISSALEKMQNDAEEDRLTQEEEIVR